MKKEKISLTDNHKRSLSSTLLVVEQLLSEIKEQMLRTEHKCCYRLIRDVDNSIIENNLKEIETALSKVCSLKEKYNTDTTTQSLQRLIDTKKTKIWETLHNSKTKRIKGYGEFPKEAVKEYDNDLDALMEMTERISY
jgi:hypothetical protein